MNQRGRYWLAAIVCLSIATLWPSSAIARQKAGTVDTLWPVLSQPITHDDLIDWSRRLELTREQLIAAERLHAAYLDEAFALRQKAIDALAALDPAWLLVPAIPPVESDWRKMLAIRRSYRRDLAQRDDLLLANLGEMLAEAQQPALAGVRQQRERQRLVADGFVSPFLHDEPPVELRQLLRTLELTDDQRAAAAPILDEYELKTTRALERLADGVDAMREQWPKIVWRVAPHDGQPQPDHETFIATIRTAGQPVRGLLDDEYAAMDRLKGVLSADDWRRLAVQQAKASVWSGSEAPPTLQTIDSLMNVGDLTAEQRQALESLRAEYVLRYDQAVPDFTRANRRRLWTNPLHLGPGNYQGFLTNEEIMAVENDVQQSQQAYFQVMQEGRDAVRNVFDEARWAELRKIVTDEISRSRLQRNRDAESAAGNLVEFSWHLRPWHLSSDRPQWSVIEQAAKAIGASATQIEVLRAAHAAFAEAVNAQTALIEQAVANTNTRQLTEDWGDRARAMHAAAAQAIEQVAALDAAFAQAVREALDGSSAAERAWIIELARQWEMISSGACNAPPPISLMSSSSQVMLTGLQDRVNPVAGLLAIEMDEPLRLAALAELQARTPAIAQASGRLRVQAAEAYRNSVLMQAEGRQTSGTRTRDDWARYEQIQKDAAASAVATFQARHDLLKAISDALASAQQTLADEAVRNAFHERIGREAFPIAWNPVAVAAGVFIAAERAPGLDDSPLAAVRAAAAAHAAAMREQAMSVETLLDAYALSDGPQRDARCRAAVQFAVLEQALLRLDEQKDAAWMLLRPILSGEQMRSIAPVRPGE